MEEATRNSFIESNVSMLKEADVERETLAEIGRGRKAEQEKQVPLTCNAQLLMIPFL